MKGIVGFLTVSFILLGCEDVIAVREGEIAIDTFPEDVRTRLVPRTASTESMDNLKYPGKPGTSGSDTDGRPSSSSSSHSDGTEVVHDGSDEETGFRNHEDSPIRFFNVSQSKLRVPISLPESIQDQIQGERSEQQERMAEYLRTLGQMREELILDLGVMSSPTSLRGPHQSRMYHRFDEPLRDTEVMRRLNFSLLNSYDFFLEQVEQVTDSHNIDDLLFYFPGGGGRLVEVDENSVKVLNEERGEAPVETVEALNGVENLELRVAAEDELEGGPRVPEATSEQASERELEALMEEASQRWVPWTIPWTTDSAEGAILEGHHFSEVYFATLATLFKTLDSTKESGEMVEFLSSSSVLGNLGEKRKRLQLPEKEGALSDEEEAWRERAKGFDWQFLLKMLSKSSKEESGEALSAFLLKREDGEMKNRVEEYGLFYPNRKAIGAGIKYSVIEENLPLLDLLMNPVMWGNQGQSVPLKEEIYQALVYAVRMKERGTETLNRLLHPDFWCNVQKFTQGKYDEHFRPPALLWESLAALGGEGEWERFFAEDTLKALYPDEQDNDGGLDPVLERSFQYLQRAYKRIRGIAERSEQLGRLASNIEVPSKGGYSQAQEEENPLRMETLAVFDTALKILEHYPIRNPYDLEELGTLFDHPIYEQPISELNWNRLTWFKSVLGAQLLNACSRKGVGIRVGQIPSLLDFAFEVDRYFLDKPGLLPAANPYTLLEKLQTALKSSNFLTNVGHSSRSISEEEEAENPGQEEELVRGRTTVEAVPESVLRALLSGILESTAQSIDIVSAAGSPSAEERAESKRKFEYFASRVSEEPKNLWGAIITDALAIFTNPIGADLRLDAVWGDGPERILKYIKKVLEGIEPTSDFNFNLSIAEVLKSASRYLYRSQQTITGHQTAFDKISIPTINVQHVVKVMREISDAIRAEGKEVEEAFQLLALYTIPKLWSDVEPVPFSSQSFKLLNRAMPILVALENPIARAAQFPEATGEALLLRLALYAPKFESSLEKFMKIWTLISQRASVPSIIYLRQAVEVSAALGNRIAKAVLGKQEGQEDEAPEDDWCFVDACEPEDYPSVWRFVEDVSRDYQFKDLMDPIFRELDLGGKNSDFEKVQALSDRINQLGSQQDNRSELVRRLTKNKSSGRGDLRVIEDEVGSLDPFMHLIMLSVRDHSPGVRQFSNNELQEILDVYRAYGKKSSSRIFVVGEDSLDRAQEQHLNDLPDVLKLMAGLGNSLAQAVLSELEDGREGYEFLEPEPPDFYQTVEKMIGNRPTLKPFQRALQALEAVETVKVRGGSAEDNRVFQGLYFANLFLNDQSHKEENSLLSKVFDRSYNSLWAPLDEDIRSKLGGMGDYLLAIFERESSADSPFSQFYTILKSFPFGTSREKAEPLPEENTSWWFPNIIGLLGPIGFCTSVEVPVLPAVVDPNQLDRDLYKRVIRRANRLGNSLAQELLDRERKIPTGRSLRENLPTIISHAAAWGNGRLLKVLALYRNRSLYFTEDGFHDAVQEAFEEAVARGVSAHASGEQRLMGQVAAHTLQFVFPFLLGDEKADLVMPADFVMPYEFVGPGIRFLRAQPDLSPILDNISEICEALVLSGEGKENILSLPCFLEEVQTVLTSIFPLEKRTQAQEALDRALAENRGIPYDRLVNDGVSDLPEMSPLANAIANHLELRRFWTVLAHEEKQRSEMGAPLFLRKIWLQMVFGDPIIATLSGQAIWERLIYMAGAALKRGEGYLGHAALQSFLRRTWELASLAYGEGRAEQYPHVETLRDITTRLHSFLSSMEFDRKKGFLDAWLAPEKQPETLLPSLRGQTNIELKRQALAVLWFRLGTRKDQWINTIFGPDYEGLFTPSVLEERMWRWAEAKEFSEDDLLSVSSEGQRFLMSLRLFEKIWCFVENKEELPLEIVMERMTEARYRRIFGPDGMVTLAALLRLEGGAESGTREMRRRSLSLLLNDLNSAPYREPGRWEELEGEYVGERFSGWCALFLDLNPFRNSAGARIAWAQFAKGLSQEKRKLFDEMTLSVLPEDEEFFGPSRDPWAYEAVMNLMTGMRGDAEGKIALKIRAALLEERKDTRFRDQFIELFFGHADVLGAHNLPVLVSVAKKAALPLETAASSNSKSGLSLDQIGGEIEGMESPRRKLGFIHSLFEAAIQSTRREALAHPRKENENRPLEENTPGAYSPKQLAQRFIDLYDFLDAEAASFSSGENRTEEESTISLWHQAKSLTERGPEVVDWDRDRQDVLSTFVKMNSFRERVGEMGGLFQAYGWNFVGPALSLEAEVGRRVFSMLWHGILKEEKQNPFQKYRFLELIFGKQNISALTPKVFLKYCLWIYDYLVSGENHGVFPEDQFHALQNHVWQWETEKEIAPVISLWKQAKALTEEGGTHVDGESNWQEDRKAVLDAFVKMPPFREKEWKVTKIFEAYGWDQTGATLSLEAELGRRIFSVLWHALSKMDQSLCLKYHFLDFVFGAPRILSLNPQAFLTRCLGMYDYLVNGEEHKILSDAEFHALECRVWALQAAEKELQKCKLSDQETTEMFQDNVTLLRELIDKYGESGEKEQGQRVLDQLLAPISPEEYDIPLYLRGPREELGRTCLVMALPFSDKKLLAQAQEDFIRRVFLDPGRAAASRAEIWRHLYSIIRLENAEEEQEEEGLASS